MLKRRTFMQLVAATGASAVSGVTLGGCSQAHLVSAGSAGAADEGTLHLVYDSLGRTFELDRAAGVVRVVSPEASRVIELGANAYPRAVAVDSVGRVAIIDAAHHSVHVLDAEFRPLFVVRNASLLSPSDVAFASDGTLLVSDGAGHVVHRYGARGEALGAWGELGTELGQLNGPRALTVAANGDVHVVEAGNYRVQVFDAHGLSLGTYGDLSAGVAIEFDGLGRSWVADRVAGEVSIFESGSLVDSYLADGGAPYALSGRPDGSVYVAVV